MISATFVSPQQLHEGMVEAVPAHCFPLQQLPTPLLALVASHLPLASLLRLQRCSSAHHRLCSDESYMATAWRWAKVRLTRHPKLHEWALPIDRCILSDLCGDERCLIPLSVWRAAVPVFRAALANCSDIFYCDNGDRHQRLRKWMREEQPTVWVWARQSWSGKWWHVDDKGRQPSADVRRVEVLRDIDRGRFDKEVFPDLSGVRYFEQDVRCPLVLRACPYLQHLDIAFDTFVYRFPNLNDIYALAPRLRTLRLARVGDNSGWGKRPIALVRLHQLTSLHCTNICFLGVADILDIACHTTLDDVYLDVGARCIDEWQWLGCRVKFPISVEEDERRMATDAHRMEWDGDIELEEEREALPAALADRLLSSENDEQLTDGRQAQPMTKFEWEVQRMCTALTRTQPTQRSCEVRLTLAEWLHRRLRRGRLYTDERLTHYDLSKARLRQYRQLVALLRCTLRQQLKELATLSAGAK